ncbi:MAG TPA: hypothetical protein VKP60_20965, partial [Magnetospirillaceae bacterium]|nr:hypothetical protein [Magnetospirillaceae bacterium]
KFTSDWGWFGRWVLVSPLHHRLHHSRNPDDYGANFGTMLVWDHLFGTFRQPTSDAFPLGVDEPAYRTTKGSMGMLVLEWVEAAGLAASAVRGLIVLKPPGIGNAALPSEGPADLSLRLDSVALSSARQDLPR